MGKRDRHAQVSGGNVELKNIHATHGDTSVEFSGRAGTSPSGAWTVHLTPFIVNRVSPTRELMAALPKRLGDALARLNVSGLVSMSGSLDLAGVRGNPAPPTANWALDVDLEDGGIDCGTRLEHIHGGVLLEGRFDGATVSSRGELGVDSLLCKGIQLTRVGGPIQLEDARLWLGEWIPEALRGTPPRPVTANAWGGLLSGNAEVALGEEAEFNLDVKLAEGDLAAISREATIHRRDIRGRTFANILLSGNSGGVHTLRGRGRIELREADIYELPVMVAS